MLQKNQRFLDDVQRYTSAIERLENEIDQLEAKKLLSDLVFEVKKMDSMYLDMVYSKQLGSMGNEFKENIVSIRKKLDSKLKLSKAA